MLRNNRLAPEKLRFLIWSTIVFLLLLFALIGPFFVPHDPYEVDLSQVNEAPSKQYIMGTDYIGRDIFSRLIEGSARSIYAAILVVAITFIIGTTVGVLSGYFGGIVDTVMMRIVDSFQAFPSFVFTVAVAGMLGPGMFNLIIAMTMIGWVGYARLARSQAITLKERTYVDAAKISGFSSWQVLFKTVLPNSLRPLVVFASMHIGNAILSFAGLSYLGLGTSPPYPEWGTMLNEGKDKLQTAPWGVLFPGFAILIVVMVMGMFGDSINEMLNPKKRSK